MKISRKGSFKHGRNSDDDKSGSSKSTDTMVLDFAEVISLFLMRWRLYFITCVKSKLYKCLIISYSTECVEQLVDTVIEELSGKPEHPIWQKLHPDKPLTDAANKEVRNYILGALSKRSFSQPKRCPKCKMPSDTIDDPERPLNILYYDPIGEEYENREIMCKFRNEVLNDAERSMYDRIRNLKSYEEMSTVMGWTVKKMGKKFRAMLEKARKFGCRLK